MREILKIGNAESEAFVTKETWALSELADSVHFLSFSTFNCSINNFPLELFITQRANVCLNIGSRNSDCNVQ